jgi:hypothetical protein
VVAEEVEDAALELDGAVPLAMPLDALHPVIRSTPEVTAPKERKSRLVIA